MAQSAAGLVLDLGEVRGEHARIVGAKLARLGDLAARGWPVPDGYVITAAALDEGLSSETRRELWRLTAGLSADMRDLETRSAAARELIEGQPLPAVLEDAILAAHAGLEGRTGLGDKLQTAVRSSGISEDGLSASFAGQFDTYLGIQRDDVLGYIRKCWASLFTSRSLDYRRRRDLPLDRLDLAVGVLQLVDARSAGVAFTSDPVQNDRRRVVIEANWGFGESVASGQVTPDQWIVDKASGQILEHKVSAKTVWSAFDASAGRVTECACPYDLVDQPCLEPFEVEYIAAKACEIEMAEGGSPQDVEWAIERNLPFPSSVFILQHRPETTWTQRELEAAKPYDPIQYALANVFKIPGF